MLGSDPQLLLVVGAMKSGTSSLHRYLDLHPEIRMSRRKELNFFIEEFNYGRGLAWYRKQLRAGARYWGESSVNYTKDPAFAGVPQRIAEAFPQARLIYVLREPIARILSHYLHNRAHGREERDLETALAHPERNPYVLASCYHRQLELFRAHFDAKQILVVDQLRLREERRTCLREVFEFLGVDSEFQHADFRREHHPSSQKGEPNPLGRWLMKRPGGKELRSVVPRLFERPLERPQLDGETRRRLVAVLGPDVAALRATTGIPFAHWDL